MIDTNILINFGIYTPPEIHVTFWGQFREVIKAGKITIIEDVAEECKSEFLQNLFAEQGIKDKVIKVDENVRKNAIDINHKYTMITKVGNRSKSEADPVIIAYAQSIDGCVFTAEGWSRKPGGAMKIPMVCRKLGVPCIRLPGKVLPHVMSRIG